MKREIADKINEAKAVYNQRPFVTKLYMANFGYDMDFLKKYWLQISGERSLKPRLTIKEKAAEILSEFLGRPVNPRDFKINKGCRHKSDVCAWEINYPEMLMSYDTLTEIVRAKKVCWIDSPNYIGPKQISTC